MNALNGAYNDLGEAEKSFINNQLKENKIEICCYDEELYKKIMAAQDLKFVTKAKPRITSCNSVNKCRKIKRG